MPDTQLSGNTFSFQSPEKSLPKSNSERKNAKPEYVSPSSKSKKKGKKHSSHTLSSAVRIKAKKALEETEADRVIIEQVHYKGSKIRRIRKSWSDAEIQDLQKGVEKHGEGSWASIIRDPEFNFEPERTVVDLKDKWRNIANYLSYNQRPIRSYILVDKNHQPILNQNGNQKTFRNRYPRDAAMKVATKAEFYPTDDSFIDIYLRETVGEGDRPPIVHVYRGTRQKYFAAQILKFSGRKTMWVASVEKVREEQLFSRDTIVD